MGLNRHLPHWLLVLILAVGLAALGPARSVPALSAGGPDLSAYALPDGTLPDLCEWDQDGARQPHGIGAHCPACLVGKALLDVPTLGLPSRTLVVVAGPIARAPRMVLARSHACAPPARGPPFMSMA